MTGRYNVLNGKAILLAAFFSALSVYMTIPVQQAAAQIAPSSAAPSLTAPSYAQTAPSTQAYPYNVAGVRVDVTAANAVDARKQAFEQAQQAAFSLLASRFLTQDQMKQFKAPPVDQITPIVDDFEITNEKLSPTRYVGTYTFRFRKDAARALINAQIYAQAYDQNNVQGTYPVHDDNGVYNPNVAYNPHTADPDAAYNPNAAYNPAAVMPVPGLADTTFRIRVHFTSLAQWVKMQKTLRDITGTTDLRVLSLTPAEALIALHFQRSEAALRLALGQSGLTLQAENPLPSAPARVTPETYNPYAAALNATAAATTAPVYDLVASPATASPLMPFPANPPPAAYRNPAYR